jgi:hypothetical protein
MDCITATTKLSSNGYPTGRAEGRQMNAHRAAWVKAYGSLPSDVFVLHTCDNPMCINLAHLFLGSHADNMRDKANKGRCRNQHTGKTHCANGHEFSPENTSISSSNGQRVCKACARDRQRKWKETHA